MLDLFKDHLALRLSNELNAKKNINVASSVSFDKTAEKYELTKKERVVLEMLSHGESAEQISGQLDEIKRKIEDAEKTTTFINNKIWETDAWKTSIEKVLYLTGSKRSENEEYINTLNNIAIGKNLKQCVSYINTIVEIRNFAKLLYEQTGAVYLTAYRNEVDAINEYHVAQHKLTDSMYTELEYKENKQVIR